MSAERIEAAAKAAARDEDSSNWHDEPENYRNGWYNRMASGVMASDAMMFSGEAIERAAKALSPNPKHWAAFIPTVESVVKSLQAE